MNTKTTFQKRRNKNYEENKNNINQKHVCERCNGRYTPWHRSAHIKTRLHLEAMNRERREETKMSGEAIDV